MRAANRTGADAESDPEQEGLGEVLDKGGKQAKKLLKKLRKAQRDDEDDEDDDDDERNPYASEVSFGSTTEVNARHSPWLFQASESESSEPEESKDTKPPATESRSSTPTVTSRSDAAQLPGGQKTPFGASRPTSVTGSRSGSPVPSANLVAKRAASPRPRPTSRAGSPSAPRSGAASAAGSRSGSPVPAGSKRKAAFTGEGESKRVKHGSPSPAPSDDSWLITDELLVNYMKSKGQVATRELIHHFKTHMRKDPRNREGLQEKLQRLAVLEGGFLRIRT
jgi:hypothetical protein